MNTYLIIALIIYFWINLICFYVLISDWKHLKLKNDAQSNQEKETLLKMLREVKEYQK